MTGIYMPWDTRGSTTAKQTSLRLRKSGQVQKGSERFHEILKELGALHDLKQQDYGTDNDPFANVRASEHFGVPGWIGCIMRGHDKMIRLMKAARGGTMSNESIEDSLRDLAVYAIIGLCLREEKLDADRKLGA
jgi:hypothetical protein